MVDERSVFDIGLHDGNDTAYYLDRGHRVVAVDANPDVVTAAQTRFAKEVRDGRLTLVNIGVGDREGTLPFYVNPNDDKLSSFDAALAGRPLTACREILVQVVPLQTLFERYGIPYYLKVDIEGNDECCARALLGASELPRFVSFELFLVDENAILEPLRAVGYRRYKLIYGPTLSQAEPIFAHELGARLLRKLSRRVPLFGRAMRALPEPWRPAKDEFSRFRESLSYPFGEGCTGPFGDDTHGPWHSFEHVRSHAARLRKKAARDPIANLWYDVHATL